ncbi:MAG TPA: SOS response-associated peptidase [Kiloniellales bacterium]|jgi:putative SOS response-associated peptidase YedK
MCGRFSLITLVEEVRAYFDVPEPPDFMPRANIAPRQAVAAIRMDGGEGEGDAARHLVWLRWGLIPAWAKDAAIGDRLINARAESIADKPAFRAAFRSRRCLIPADGFYEWRGEGARKQPYRITVADSPIFGFAGIWERWRDPRSREVFETCAILTTEAVPALRPIHHRMPVIIDPADFPAWLAPGTTAEAALAIVARQPARAFTSYTVSTRINRAANDDPTLMDPADPVVEASAQPRLL